MKSTGILHSAWPAVLPLGRHERARTGPRQRADESQLIAGDGERLLRIVSQAAQIRSHYELFTLLQGEIQYFIPHRILIGVWGNFLEPDLSLDVISAIDGVRTSRLNCCSIQLQCKRLYLRWLAQGRNPLVLDGEACELRMLPLCRCPLHESLRGMQAILVHGFHDARGDSDSLYVAAHSEPAESLSGKLRARFLLDSVVAQIDVAFRRVAGLKLPLAVASTEVGGLSRREEEILRWVSEGRTNREISTILGISTFTVKNHVQRIIRKLGAVNRIEAAARYRHLAAALERPVDLPGHAELDPRGIGVAAK